MTGIGAEQKLMSEWLLPVLLPQQPLIRLDRYGLAMDATHQLSCRGSAMEFQPLGAHVYGKESR